MMKIPSPYQVKKSQKVKKAIVGAASVFIFCTAVQAQYAYPVLPPQQAMSFTAGDHFGSAALSSPIPKLYQRNYGMIIGLQRGRSTFFELGGEAHWRKISLKKPTIIGANANLEYNFGHHILGYKAGIWRKQGRVNFTYGGNVSYYTDFNNHSKFGIGPAIGFRLLGFHLINGYNILIGDKELGNANALYMTLRYYFPIDNKFTWDRKNKNNNDKARERKKREKAKERKQKDKGEKKKILGLFSI